MFRNGEVEVYAGAGVSLKVFNLSCLQRLNLTKHLRIGEWKTMKPTANSLDTHAEYVPRTPGLFSK